MENKINIAELLKDCPRGMELDCTMYDNIVFDYVDEKSSYPIKCMAKITDVCSNSCEFTKNGQPNHYSNAKCVIFPKGKTTWEGFVPPCEFKDGDVVTMENECGIHIFIYNHTTGEYGGYGYYAILTSRDNFKINGFCSGSTYRFATEEERQKLFDAIKANGYRWNAKTKTLKKLIKPIFKKGDKVRTKSVVSQCRIIDDVFDTFYSLVPIGKIDFTDQDNWELVPNKFDITTLKPFESKVLIRSVDEGLWKPAIYGFLHSNGCYVVGGACWKCCIPYEGNQHLLGTTNNCDDFYKTWKE